MGHLTTTTNGEPVTMAKKPAKKKENVPATVGKRPSWMPEEETNVPTSEGSFPAVKLIQSQSPERTKNSEKFVKGADEGMLLVTGANHLIDGENVGLLFHPLQARKMWNIWTPRDEGGGLVSSHTTKKEAQDSGDVEGNDLQVCIEYAVHLPEFDEIVILRFDTPTKQKIARKLAALIENAGTMYGGKYRLWSKHETNKAQQSYYNFDVEFEGWTDKKTYGYLEDQTAEVNKMLPGPDDSGI